MPSASIEDYIKTIYGLESRGQKPTTGRIARELGITMGSVSGRVRHLADKGYVDHRPYYGVTLTDRGRRVALKMLRRHRLIELFLVKTLGLTWDEVHADAEILEHAVSDRVLERMYEVLGQPEFDPHGSPIPDRNGKLRRHKAVRLSDLGVGARGRVVEVSDSDGAFLRYLTSVGLDVGTPVRLDDRAPFGGPLVLCIGRRQLAIGPDAAERILVELDA